MKPYQTFAELAPRWSEKLKKPKLTTDEEADLQYTYCTCAMAEVRLDNSDYFADCVFCQGIADLFTAVYFHHTGPNSSVEAITTKMGLQETSREYWTMERVEQLAVDHVNKTHLATRRLAEP